MLNSGKLAGKTVFITGASRGIGKAIALKVARDGANVVVAAKTAEPHPKLPGTVYSACEEVEKAGGKALPCIVDIRDEQAVASAVKSAVDKFGGIDILINNASAINLSGTEGLEMKRYDLMHSINSRGTFLCSKLCIPFIKNSAHPHILNISPPLNMNPFWFKNHVAYTIAKYGMSMNVLGMAEEFRSVGVNVNALWPRTAIQTAAMDMLVGSESAAGQSRKPEIMADAAYAILSKPKGTYTGNFAIDDEVLKAEGITDLDQYACVPGSKLLPDFFLDEAMEALQADLRTSDMDAVSDAKKTAKPAASGNSSSAAASSSGANTVSGVFDRIQLMVDDKIISKIGATYEFNLSGDEAGKWFLNLKDSAAARSGKGDSPIPTDVEFTMKSADFVKMFAGNLKPTTAFMMGKLKIKGDMGKAMKLEKMMKSMSSKL